MRPVCKLYKLTLISTIYIMYPRTLSLFTNSFMLNENIKLSGLRISGQHKEKFPMPQNKVCQDCHPPLTVQNKPANLHE